MTHAQAPKFFKSYRKKIGQHIVASIKKQKKELSLVGPPWVGDFFDELLRFAHKGKMIRGSLVLFGVQLAGKKIDKNAISLAVAMEFMHSSFLIHDDIMDRDTLRRGNKTLHTLFADFGKKEHVSDPDHFGISSAICVGDLGFFLAYYYLEQASVKHNRHMQAVRTLFSTEVSKVALAQIIDVAEGMKTSTPTMQSVLHMYKHKTARYTFSLPFLMGAMFAGADKTTLKKLSAYGEAMGMLFQIQDDYLGLFGDMKKTGKSVGTDIIEGKKTPYYILLSEQVSQKEKKEIREMQKKKKLSKKDITYMHNLMMQYGVIKEIDKIKGSLRAQAQKTIAGLKISIKNKKELISLLAYIEERKR